MLKNITIGADPEYFLLKDNFIVPPIFSLGEGETIRYKDDFPYRIYSQTNEVSIESDGAAFELVTKPVPLTDWESLYEILSEGRLICNNLLKEAGFETGLQALPAAELQNAFLCNETQLTGCSPDLDAFNTAWKCKEKLEGSFARYAGGHIHIGFGDETERQQLQKNPFGFVHLLTLLIGIPCLIRSEKREEEKIRLKKYGRPGRFRVPPYGASHGIEFRSPSCRWTVQKLLAKEIFENLEQAICIYRTKDQGNSLLKAFVPTAEKLFQEQQFEGLTQLYQEVIVSI